MRKATICILLLLFGFMPKADNGLEQHILKYYSDLPQEKIYVHTDKSNYMAGDTVWYRAYLLDAATNEISDRSKFVYIELYDNLSDSLVSRSKVKLLPSYLMHSDTLCTDSTEVYASALPLSPKLRTGTYTLVAYTSWMINFGDESFFNKQLRIISRHMTHNRDLLDDNGTTKHVLSDNISVSSGLSLSVMPEGGNLLANCDQILAYKAIDNSGNGIDIDVSLLDEQGNVLLQDRSQHLGMGKLLVNVPSNNVYSLLAETSTGEKCITKLPLPLDNGVSLSVAQHTGNLYIQTISTPCFSLDNLAVAIYGAGNLMTFEGLNLSQPIVIPLQKLKTGVVNIALVDTSSNIVWAERLVFVK